MRGTNRTDRYEPIVDRTFSIRDMAVLVDVMTVRANRSRTSQAMNLTLKAILGGIVSVLALIFQG